jgi:hypothetical protein
MFRSRELYFATSKTLSHCGEDFIGVPETARSIVWYDRGNRVPEAALHIFKGHLRRSNRKIIYFI